MFNRHESTSSSSNNLISAMVFGCFTLIVAVYVAYLTFKNRAQKKRAPIHIPTSKIKQAAILQRQAQLKQETTFSAPQIASSITTTKKFNNKEQATVTDTAHEDKKTTPTVITSSPSSAVMKVKERSPKVKKTSPLNSKTLAIQAALEQKKLAKAQEKKQSEEEAVQAAIRREAEKKAWQEKLAKEKEEARVKAELEAEKAKAAIEAKEKKAEFASPSSSPSIDVTPRKSVAFEAKKLMKLHALSLANFEYDNETKLGVISGQTTLCTLNFLYHFHRYNLCRRILKDDLFDQDKAVELRTMLVHLANRVDITPALILETQTGLCQFMTREVKRVAQVYGGNGLLIRNDKDVAELEILTTKKINANILMSMERLRIVELFSSSEEDINNHPASPVRIEMRDLLKWFYTKIIPLINTVNHLDIPGKCEMLAMIIIVAGEYCSSLTRNAMRYHVNKVDADTLGGNAANFIKFMKLCRAIRNDFSHNIFEPDAETINSLINLSEKISTARLTMDEIKHSLQPLDGILTAPLEKAETVPQYEPVRFME